jgi:hypothetical protein
VCEVAPLGTQQQQAKALARRCMSVAVHVVCVCRVRAKPKYTLVPLRLEGRVGLA